MESCICQYCAFNLGEPTIRFAEDNVCGLIAQPANSWSNVGFILIAFFITFQIHKHKKYHPILWGFPLTYVFIGVSSFFYHASASFVGQFLDFGSMYIFSAYLLYLALSKRIKKLQKLTIGISVITSLLFILLWFFPNLRILIFGSQLALFVYLELSSLPPKRSNQITQLKNSNNSIKNLQIALGIFFLAWGVWWLDLLKIWDCKPLQHYINGHAVWHLLTAISLYFVFRHYASNLNQNKQVSIYVFYL